MNLNIRNNRKLENIEAEKHIVLDSIKVELFEDAKETVEKFDTKAGGE